MALLSSLFYCPKSSSDDTCLAISGACTIANSGWLVAFATFPFAYKTCLVQHVLMLVRCSLFMTDQEIDEWDASIDASEARHAANMSECQRIADRCLLRKLKMSEDGLIQSKRYFSQFDLKVMRDEADEFEYDPLVRGAVT